MGPRSTQWVRAAALVVAMLVALPGPVAAVEPNEVLADAKLETRARALSAQLRCLVCQNQSIDDSNAPLARDLRLLVRERLTSGDSDEAVKEFIVNRYGTFVLLKPPLAPATALLWLGPLLLLGATAAIILVRLRRSRVAPPSERLTSAEEARLRQILSND